MSDIISSRDGPSGGSARGWLRTASAAVSQRVPSIRLRLILLIASVLIPLLLLALFIAVRYADAERRVVEAQRYDIANNLAYLLQRDIERVKGVLWGLAVSPDLAEGKLDVFRRHAEAATKLAGIDAIMLHNASGEELVSTVAGPPRTQRTRLEI